MFLLFILNLNQIKLNLHFYLFLFYFIILFFFQLPNYLICPNCFSLLAHLVFYITFVSNFHPLLVCMYYL